MTPTPSAPPDPRLDLVLERIVDVPPALDPLVAVARTMPASSKA